MTAKEFLKSDECPNIKNGFGLNDMQMSVLAVIMQEYTDKQLLIQRVSQQRELLLDFANKYWNPQENPDNFIKEEYIDDYLKSNNCG